MEVSSITDVWHKIYVIGKNKKGAFLAWNSDGDHIHTWPFARPIPKRKITRKEFESKFEIID